MADHQFFFSIVIPTYNRRFELQRTLDSLRALQTDVAPFEVIVIDDGSTDSTPHFLETSSFPFPLRYCRIANSGPAVARNRGVKEAAGEWIVFTDDDCTVPSGWLKDIFSRIQSNAIHGIGGNVLNAYKDNIFSVAYDIMHQFFSRELNADPHQAQFLTTNNLAIHREAFLSVGGFDEHFHVGGEDRDLIVRLQNAGFSIFYDGGLLVDHYRKFTFRSYCRQFYRYGVGAHFLHSHAATLRAIKPTRLTKHQYVRMCVSPFFTGTFPGAVVLVALIILGQWCVIVGYGLARLEDAAHHRPPSPESPSGRIAKPLFIFLTSIGVSSFFGFLYFLFAARWMSVVELGTFSACFAVISLMQYVSVSGIATGTVRYALEFQKSEGRQGIQDAVTAGTVLFSLFAIFFSLMLITGTNLLTMVSRQAQEINSLLWPTLGAALLLLLNEFLTIQYSVSLAQQKLAAVRLSISLMRFLLLVVFYGAGILTAVNALITLAVPSFLSIITMTPAFIRYLRSPVSISRERYFAIAQYSLWQTVSVSISIFCYNSGSMILFGMGKIEEAGLYGLALSVSFVFSVIQSALTTYFLPIGSRIAPDEFPDILRRTSRLSLPLVIVSVIGILALKTYFGGIFGQDKESAYLPFALLSLGYILGYVFPLMTIGLHVFLKPKYITWGLLTQLGIFSGLLVFWRADSALHIAAAFFISRIGYMLSTWIFLHKELRAQHIHIPVSLYLTFGFGNTSFK